MTTDTLVQPETEVELHADTRQTHWVCLHQDQMPYLGLCGDLPVERRRRPGDRITCPRCLPLIREHVATCGACPFAGRYR